MRLLATVLLVALSGLACVVGNNDCSLGEEERDGVCVPANEGGNWSSANVAACEAYLADENCSGVEDALDCSGFDEPDCDLQPYFDCIAGETECTEEEGLDTSGWRSCADLLECGAS